MVHTFVFSVQKFKKIMSLRTCYSFIKIFNSNARCMSFKSGCAIDKIYPNSNEIKHLEPPVSEDGKFNGYIPVKELVISYTKAGAPGGQNVHKNETKVDLRFNVASATWIRESTKQKLLSKYGTRINKDGFFIIRSEKTRHRDLNLADALTYLREILFKLEDPEPTPSPESLEKIRKNKEKANRIRLMEKRYHSLKKQSKGSIDLSDI